MIGGWATGGVMRTVATPPLAQRAVPTLPVAVPQPSCFGRRRPWFSQGGRRRWWRRERRLGPRRTQASRELRPHGEHQARDQDRSRGGFRIASRLASDARGGGSLARRRPRAAVARLPSASRSRAAVARPSSASRSRAAVARLPSASCSRAAAQRQRMAPVRVPSATAVPPSSLPSRPSARRLRPAAARSRPRAPA